MNIDNLYQLIKNPSSIQKSDIGMLKELSEKHPYTQLYPILYLNGLALHKDIHFEDELKNYAYCITDRAKLYDMIHAFGESNTSISNENLIEGEKINNQSSTQEITHVIEDISPDLPEINSQFEENRQIENLIPVNQTAEETITEKVDLIKTEEIEIEEIKSEEINLILNEEDLLEKEILSNIIASSYSLEFDEKTTHVKEEKNDFNKEKKSEKIDLHAERSFTSWLNISKTEAPLNTDSPSKEQVIDKFIELDFQISKPKTEFYSAPKKAKESINENKLMYTETLANIFALQGNFPKAIKAFEQLSLTLPEKKLYFAQKIEELNKKINS